MMSTAVMPWMWELLQRGTHNTCWKAASKGKILASLHVLTDNEKNE